MRQAGYDVLLEWDPEERVYVATIPALSVATYGSTEKEALAMAREAIDVTVEGLKATGQPVPKEIE